MTKQQMNDYLLKNAEQKIKDDVSLSKRLYWSYRTWVLAVIKNGRDQLMSKPTSESGKGETVAGSEGAESGEAGAEMAGEIGEEGGNGGAM